MFGTPYRDTATVEQLDGGLKNLPLSLHNDKTQLGAVASNSGWCNFQNSVPRK